MIITSIILNIVLLLWVLVLSLQIKKLTKDLSQFGRWNAYLETTIKDAQILVLNPEKGEHGEYEVNRKLTNLLK